MKCPSCGNENREGAAFCDSCGARLALPAVEGATPAAPAAAAEPASPSPGPLPEGIPHRVAGHLEMVGFIGRGGRKDVFLARDDAEPGREVAVALFDTEGLGETALARARREMLAMERLGEHPHLVPVYGDRGAGRARLHRQLLHGRRGRQGAAGGGR